MKYAANFSVQIDMMVTTASAFTIVFIPLYLIRLLSTVGHFLDCHHLVRVGICSLEKGERNTLKELSFLSFPWSKLCLWQAQAVFSSLASPHASPLQRHLPCDKIQQSTVRTLFPDFTHLSIPTVPPSALTALATSVLTPKPRPSLVCNIGLHPENMQSTVLLELQ